jgi:hypothetical protein
METWVIVLHNAKKHGRSKVRGPFASKKEANNFLTEFVNWRENDEQG